MGETGAESPEGKVSTPTEASQGFLNNWQKRATLTLNHLVPPLGAAGTAMTLLTETYPEDARILMAIGQGVGAGLYTILNVSRETAAWKKIGELEQKLKQRLIKH